MRLAGAQRGHGSNELIFTRLRNWGLRPMSVAETLTAVSALVSDGQCEARDVPVLRRLV